MVCNGTFVKSSEVENGKGIHRLKVTSTGKNSAVNRLMQQSMVQWLMQYIISGIQILYLKGLYKKTYKGHDSHQNLPVDTKYCVVGELHRR